MANAHGFFFMVIFESTFALLFYSEGYILLNENNSYFEIQKRVTGAIKKKEKPEQIKMPLMY